MRSATRANDHSDIERLAKELEAEQRSARNAQQAVVRAAEMSKGEFAALVFERFEQRHSLSEIMIETRRASEARGEAGEEAVDAMLHGRRDEC